MFAERWTPLVLRELLAGGHRFSELQRGLPGIPRALLTQRLGSLQRAGLIEKMPLATAVPPRAARVSAAASSSAPPRRRPRWRCNRTLIVARLQPSIVAI